jgi:glycerate kinase
MRYLEVDSLLGEVDLVVTAEGAIDFQTPRGKVPAEVAQRAKRNHLPVIVLAGTIGKEADVNFACGIDSYSSILEAPCTLSQAIENTPQLLTREAERVMRLILVGEKLKTS